MKMNNFRGDLTDISAKKEALVAAADTKCAIDRAQKVHFKGILGYFRNAPILRHIRHATFLGQFEMQQL